MSALTGGAPERPPWRILKLALVPRDRARLHARIAERFDAMLAAGFLDEVRRLRTRADLDADLPALRAVGYRQALEHLEGATDAPMFRERAIFATRQLAKRQVTWLRGELDARWFDPDGATSAEAVAAAVGAFLAPVR
jgi:tRNA dimethylallyltransferase